MARNTTKKIDDAEDSGLAENVATCGDSVFSESETAVEQSNDAHNGVGTQKTPEHENDGLAENSGTNENGQENNDAEKTPPEKPEIKEPEAPAGGTPHPYAGMAGDGCAVERKEAPLLEQGDALVSITVLSDRHRVPSWQVAALLRLMGWESDRMATDAEFQEGLRMLQNRRIGGGRM